MKPPIFSSGPQIEKLESVDLETFRSSFVNEHRPVIFGSGIQDWPALQTWSPDYVREQFPHLEVIDEHTQECTELHDFVDKIENGDPTWGRIHRIDDYARMLADVSPLPEYLSDSWIQGKYMPTPFGLRNRIVRSSRPDLLIGGTSSYFPVYHYEHSLCHCFMFQVFGSKRVVLFEPGEKHALYPDTSYPNKSSLSPVELPAAESYPLFRDARYIVGTLEPGDTLYAPCGWWIGIRNPEISLTVRRHYVERTNWPLFCREFRRELKAQDPGLVHSLKVALAAILMKMMGIVYASSRNGR